MSRYNDDIPEVFRRAMEEAGWQEDDDNGGQEPPRSAHPQKPWWTNRWLWIVGLGILLFASFNWIITTYTEWLWFREVNYESVWLKQWGAEVITFLIFFLIATAVLLGNWHLARRRALGGPQSGPQILSLPGIGWLISGAGLFLAFVMGQAASGRWETFLRYFYRVPFGQNDPVFNQDISFYLFELPVYNFLQGWFMPLLVLTLLGVGTIYIVNNLPTIRGRQLEIRSLPAAMREHATLLLAVFFGLWAFGYWLNLYELVYSSRGVVFGASYTDLNATRPALYVQLVLMALVAVAMLYTAFRPDVRPVLVVGGLWLVASIGLGSVYPGLLQRYAVEPNELDREREFIDHNIDFTRLGFGLHEVQTREFVPDENITVQDLEENDAALQNIRLWDYRPLRQTYSQLQELRPYYEFGELDVDRYDVGGEIRQVMLGARELEKAALTAPTWVNLNLVFTHGYGVVMNPVDRVTAEGRPEFFIKDLPPQSTVDIEVTRPEIYYGEMTSDVVYVGSGQKEFDYPSGDTNVESNYEGLGGVPIGNFLNRLAFALRFGDVNLILSDNVTPETRVMYHRQIQQRVRHITPFLWFDHDPYIVIADGRLVWMYDGYTLSQNFPYSQPSQVGTDTVPAGINYIRNSVKLTIDAYDGTVNYYVADPDDPIIQTYAAVFPDLFQPLDTMPETLRQHIRYPEDLFFIQANQYLIYHMQDAQVFYNEEDLWEIPQEIFDGGQQPMEPYYVTFSLPGEEETEYLLIQPYTPANKNNMIAWIAARNDPPNYGELSVYELPKQELVFGPIQVEGRIDQEPEISQQFSLWNQRGSRVIRGNLIVVPINDSFLYVEPIYLQSDTSALPELQRVILASGNRIVMRDTLDEALAALVEQAPAVDQIVAEPPVEEGDGEAPAGDGEPAATPEPAPTDANVEELVQAANEHFLAAEQAQQDGDWATYGQELEALQNTLEQLLEATGGELPDAVPAAEPTPDS